MLRTSTNIIHQDLAGAKTFGVRLRSFFKQYAGIGRILSGISIQAFLPDTAFPPIL